MLTLGELLSMDRSDTFILAWSEELPHFEYSAFRRDISSLKFWTWNLIWQCSYMKGPDSSAYSPTRHADIRATL